jgi:hypothetical protein
VEAAPPNLWERLQQIPRWFVYLLLAAIVVWQLLFPIRFPIVAGKATLKVYDAIRAVPDDKLVIISADWDASTQPETGPQTAAVVHACFQLKKRFAIMNLSAPMGVRLADDIAQAAAKEYGARYGVNWCNWGYKIGGENVLMAMGKDLPKTIGDDFNGKPVTSLPMMKGVKDIKSVGLVVEVTGLAQMTEMWIGLIQGPYQVPLAAGYTAVMSPGYYPFMDSGQLKGMLVGAKGGAEMEVLVHRPALGEAIMSAQSWAHLLIIALIIVGNVGYLLARGQARRRGP